MELYRGVLILSCLTAAMMAVPTGRRDSETENSVVRPDTHPGVYKRMENGRVVTVTALGTVLTDDDVLLDMDRLWQRRARVRRRSRKFGTLGRGSATLMSALCKICRRNNATSCIRRFCSRTPDKGSQLFNRTTPEAVGGRFRLHEGDNNP